MKSNVSRRQFLQPTSAAAALSWFAGSRPVLGSPNEKLNCAFIGVAGRAGDDLREVARETASVNVAALCDVDDNSLARARQQFPSAKTFNDFREVIDLKDIDAIVVGTPDHTHAVAAVAALRSGRHVYCEKPLSRTVSEVRIVTDAARQNKRVTQIGTQIHAGSNYRRVVELVQSNVLGPVREVHVWVNAVYGGMDLPKEYPPVPAHIHYDLWLGPVPFRPYSPEWVPFKWRNWWAFGGGSLADFGCHYMDLPFWALNLKYPTSVEPVDGPPVHPESTPPWLIVRYQFPSRAHPANAEPLPPVQLTWYHGGKQPAQLDPKLAEKWRSGVLFVGTKGTLLADYGRHILLPESEFSSFAAPKPYIPESIGHHKEWIEACKTGGKTTCSFDYSGPLSETALLGNVAYRVGKKLDWNASALKAVHCPEADQYIQHHYRNGWKI